MGLSEQHSKYAALSDTELVELSLIELDAFGELVRRHQDFVYGAALRIVRNPVMAQDLAQEAFVRAHRALPGFRGQAQVRSWLYRIATNLALNAVQRRREYPTETIPDRPARRDPASRYRSICRCVVSWRRRSPNFLRNSRSRWCYGSMRA